MRNATPTDLVGIADAVRLTGLDKTTLYRLARTGRLRSFKVLGTALRFDRTDVLRLVQPREIGDPRGGSQ